MTEQSELWDSVKVSYDAKSLRQLSNINNNNATTINDTIGIDAALEVINLWNMHAQIDYDSTDASHVAVARRGTIAVLWDRGGTSSKISEVKWDSIFGTEGLIQRVRKTGPRGRQGPATNSGVTQTAENASGRNVKGWSDYDASGAEFMAPRRENARI